MTKPTYEAIERGLHVLVEQMIANGIAPHSQTIWMSKANYDEWWPGNSGRPAEFRSTEVRPHAHYVKDGELIATLRMVEIRP
jgi:hypothetical protein